MATDSPQDQKCHNGGDILTSPSASDQEDEYVVDKIIAQSGPKDGAFDEDTYLVRWEGYTDEQCTVSSWGYPLIPFRKSFSWFSGTLRIWN